MRLLRVSSTALLISVCVPGIIAAACTSLDGLSSSPVADAASSPEADPVESPKDAADIKDGAIPNLDPDVVVNPSAGLGAYLMLGERIDATTSISPIRVDPSDGAIQALACPSYGGPLLIQGSGAIREPLGPNAMRVFYHPNDPSKAKLVYPTLQEGGSANAIFLVDQSSVCSEAGSRALSFGVTQFKHGVSFSDDGTRVAFLVAPSITGYPNRLVTVATEGPLDQFELRNTESSSILIGNAPPAWVRDPEGLKVAWVEWDPSAPDYHFVVRLALDKVITSSPPILLDCGAIFYDILQLGVYKGSGGKTFLAFTAQLNPTVDGGAPSQRGIFSVDYLNSCQTRALTFPDVPTSSSFDFAIAPDGDRMAHVSTRSDAPDGGDGGVDRARIWIGSVTSHARSMCSTPGSGFFDQAPQWLAGGSQILFTRRPAATSSLGAVPMIADVAGQVCSNERPVTSLTSTQVAFTPKNGCAVGRLGGEAPFEHGALALSSLLALTLLRRRSRGAPISSRD